MSPFLQHSDHTLLPAVVVVVVVDRYSRVSTGAGQLCFKKGRTAVSTVAGQLCLNRPLTAFNKRRIARRAVETE